MSQSSTQAMALDSIPMILTRRPPESRISERRIVRAAKRGSEEAIDQLVRAHWNSAYATALGVLGDRGLAEDVAQDSVLSAIGSLGGFDLGKPFGPWLHRIVTNRALDALRVRRRRPELALADQADFTSSPGQSGLSLALLAALQTLSPRDRAIVVLRHVGGFSSNEIARIFDTSPTAIRSALQRALVHLRSELSGGRDDDPLTIGSNRE
jgi:RNA polymerase sigma-70 factor (ECF subfamily)